MGRKIGKRTYEFKKGSRKIFKTTAARDRVANVSDRMKAKKRSKK